MIGRRKTHQLLVASAIVGSLAWHSAASAQDVPVPAPAPTPSGEVVGGQAVTANDIIVTATKRTERLENVPATVLAVSGKALQNSGVVRFSDIALVAPGVQISRSGTYTQPAIRGITTSFAGGGQETNVALYIDGFYQSDQTGMNQDLSNIQDIQVLKGPQGTLYGRNATGGAILITTKSPTDKWQAEANASYAWRFNDKIGNVFIGGPITNGIKFSVSASYHKGDGYIHDINHFAPLVPLDTINYTFGGHGSLGGHSFQYSNYEHRHGRNAAPVLNWNVRPKLVLEPTDNLKITLGYVHTFVSENKSQAYIMNSNWPGSNGAAGFLDQTGNTCTPGAAVPGHSPATLSATSNLYDSVCYPHATLETTGKFKTSLNYIPLNETTQDEGNAAVEWKAGDIGTLTGRVAFRHQTDLNSYELDGTTRNAFNSASGYSSIGFNNRHTMTGQLDYSGNFGPVSILSGFFYYDDEFKSYTSNKAGTLAQTTLSNLDFKTKAWGAFIDGTYNIHDKLFINAGVRYNYDKKELFNIQWQSTIVKTNPLAPPGTPFIWAEGATTFVPTSTSFCLSGGENSITGVNSGQKVPGQINYGPCTEANHTFAKWKHVTGRAWTPHVVLRYNLSRGTNIYASWNRGFKAATINSGAPFNSLKPETVDAFEVGIKTNRGGFRGEASAFYYNYKNNQISAFNGTTTVTTNSGGAHVYGLDLTLSYQVPDMPLNLHGGMEYLHARYTNFHNAGNVTASSCADTAGPGANLPSSIPAGCNDTVGTNTTVIGDWTGRRLLRAPDWTATIGADYTLENVFGGRMIFSATAQYSSRYAPQNASYLCTYYTALDLSTHPAANTIPLHQRTSDTPGQKYCDPGTNGRNGRFEEKGWAQLNAQIQWTDRNDHFSVAFFGNNINNVHYLQVYSQPGFGKNVLYNEPRTFGVRVGVKY